MPPKRSEPAATTIPEEENDVLELLERRRLEVQRKKAREFANYLEELEEDIPEMSAEQQRAWSLLNALRSDLRAAIIKEEREIKSRAQVISSGQRLAELYAGEAQEKRKRVDSIPQAEKSSQTGKRLCYACNKEGHLAKNCPEQKNRLKT